MDVAAGEVQAVAGLELDVEQRLGALGHEVVAGAGLAGQREGQHRLVHHPPLAPGHLQDEDVVGVVVEVEALGVAARA